MPRGYFSDGYPIVPALFRYDRPMQFFDLDIDFDATEDDYELVQAIVAGKVGLEPAARSNDLDPLSVQPARLRRDELPVRHYNKVSHTNAAEPQQQYEPIPRREIKRLHEVADDVGYDVTTIPYDPDDWVHFQQYIRSNAKGLYINWAEVPDAVQREIDAYIERRYGPQ
jgi:hypothetical protein